MSSYLIRKKKYQELTQFLLENKNVYTNSLQDFLGCTYKQAYRIVCVIKNKYNIKTMYIPAEYFKKFIDEE